MEFTLITLEKLKVSLDAGDMQDLGIEYEQLDYSDPLTKQVLVSLLQRGKAETGFHPPKGAKLFIEVFPNDEGGCVLYFTCLRSGQHPPALRPASPGPLAVIFTFPDADALTEAAAKVFSQHSHRILKSSLYSLGGSYRLVVYPLDYADRLSITLLGEFAEKTGEGPVLASFIEEHGELLVGDCALDVLADYFS